MNVAIFGGTFDPVHRGHLAVAHAAQRACKLARIYFVPADVPPHKLRQPITAFEHRYAMLAIALAGEPRFIPSLMEAPTHPSKHGQGGAPNYSIDTVRRFKKGLGRTDRLFFIVGIDMFETIDTWHKPKELMREVEFIVVSRSGYEIPPQKKRGYAGARVHWIEDVAEDVASTGIRQALASGRAIRRLLDPEVVEYIRKEHLYEGSRRE